MNRGPSPFADDSNEKRIRMRNIRKLLIWASALAWSPFALSQSADIGDTQVLQRQIEVLQAGQQEIKKNLQIVKDILMGKEPPLEDGSLTRPAVAHWATRGRRLQ
jgi:hypothetical protein